MCRRFSCKLTWDELVRLYRLTLDQPPRNTQARYNVCPTDPISYDSGLRGKRELVPMRWGLVPSWWSKSLKDVKMATFNARAETVETKSFFRDAFKRTRCLIPVSGYYEWHATSGGKQPWYFTARDGSPALTVAGLWDEWKDRETGERLKCRTMIITGPTTSLPMCTTACRSFLAKKCATARQSQAIRALAERGGGCRIFEASSQ